MSLKKDEYEIIGDTLLGPEILIKKGPKNPYGSKTGPYRLAGGWGYPAGEEDLCPVCSSKTFHYEGLFAEAAINKCDECGYSEDFLY